jgi:hypothetical protein
MNISTRAYEKVTKLHVHRMMYWLNEARAKGDDSHDRLDHLAIIRILPFKRLTAKFWLLLYIAALLKPYNWKSQWLFNQNEFNIRNTVEAMLPNYSLLISDIMFYYHANTCSDNRDNLQFASTRLKRILIANVSHIFGTSMSLVASYMHHSHEQRLSRNLPLTICSNCNTKVEAH